MFNSYPFRWKRNIPHFLLFSRVYFTFLPQKVCKNIKKYVVIFSNTLRWNIHSVIFEDGYHTGAPGPYSDFLWSPICLFMLLLCTYYFAKFLFCDVVCLFPCLVFVPGKWSLYYLLLISARIFVPLSTRVIQLKPFSVNEIVKFW